MNKTRSLAMILAGLLLAASGSAWASPAGAVSFQDISDAYGAPKVEVNLGREMIGLVSAFSKGKDPEVAALLSKIEGITVRVYPLNDKPQLALDAIDSMSKKMRADQWLPVVSVREPNQNVQVFSRVTNEIMDGLVVMVVNEGEKKEAVFINVVGQIDPSQISKVAESLNISIGPQP